MNFQTGIPFSAAVLMWMMKVHVWTVTCLKSPSFLKRGPFASALMYHSKKCFNRSEENEPLFEMVSSQSPGKVFQIYTLTKLSVTASSLHTLFHNWRFLLHWHCFEWNESTLIWLKVITTLSSSVELLKSKINSFYNWWTLSELN